MVNTTFYKNKSSSVLGFIICVIFYVNIFRQKTEKNISHIISLYPLSIVWEQKRDDISSQKQRFFHSSYEHFK